MAALIPLLILQWDIVRVLMALAFQQDYPINSSHCLSAFAMPIMAEASVIRISDMAWHPNTNGQKFTLVIII